MLSKTSEEYILNDSQWPNGQSVITYSFVTHIFSDDLNREVELGLSIPSGDETRDIVREAMDTWEAVCGVRFVEVADSPSANVRIAWMPGWDSDGPGGKLGVTFTWFHGNVVGEQAVVFDWADSGSLIGLYDTALHELGHVLGIDHSNVHGVVLSGLPNTPYAYQPGRDVLQPDDIAAAVALWGHPHSSDDTVTGTIGYDGTNGNDTLIGTQGDDLITAWGGNDIIYGLRGNDTLFGGEGNDTLSGGLNLRGEGAHESTGGSNVFIGGTGNDFMTAGYAGIGSSRWTPTPGSDIFIFAPGHGHDVVNGNWGNSVGREFFGASEKIDLSLFGSLAPTWNEISQNLTTVTAASSTGHQAPSTRLDLTDFGGGSITFWNTPIGLIGASDFIGLRTGSSPNRTPPQYGTGGAERLEGGSGIDILHGEGGNDTIVGRAGDDYLTGGRGNDRMVGGTGDDLINGNTGNDLMFGLPGNDTILGGAGHDIVLGGEGNDWISGGEGIDRIWAQGGNDLVEGDEGNDFLAGGTGNDSLLGGAGSDYLAGEAGNDSLDGGAGRDIFAGGPGNDRLIGGAEGETFFGQGDADTFVIRGGTNWIMDFDSSDQISIGMNLSQVQNAATQLGEHLHVALPGGGDLYLANTTLAEIEADNLI